MGLATGDLVAENSHDNTGSPRIPRIRAQAELSPEIARTRNSQRQRFVERSVLPVALPSRRTLAADAGASSPVHHGQRGRTRRPNRTVGRLGRASSRTRTFTGPPPHAEKKKCDAGMKRTWSNSCAAKVGPPASFRRRNYRRNYPQNALVAIQRRKTPRPAECLTKTVNREKDLKRRESAELLRSTPQLAEKKEHYQRPWRKLCNVRLKEFKKHPLPSTIPDQHQCPYLYFTLSKEQGRLHTLHFFK